MSSFNAFRTFPVELQARVFEEAADIALTSTEDAPRLAIVRILPPPSRAPNWRMQGVASTYLRRERRHVVENAPHLLETPNQLTTQSRAQRLQSLLLTSQEARRVAQRALARPDHVRNPSFISELLGLDHLDLLPAQDILYLRSGAHSFNYATALGFVIGKEYPNVMLEAWSFTNGSGDTGIRPNTPPVAHSLQLLRNTDQPQFNQLYAAATGVLPEPRVPRNLYFLVADDIPACPSPYATHEMGCVHYSQLEIIPGARVGEWQLAPRTELRAQVENVAQIWAGWRALGVQLPNVFFARFPPGVVTEEIGEAEADSFTAWLGRGIDFTQNPDDLQADPEVEKQAGEENQNQNGESSEQLEVVASMWDSGIGMWNSGEMQTETMTPEQWFNAVVVPAALVQFSEKWKANNRNEPWVGQTFVEDADTPGPPANNREQQAIEEWLRVVIRPAFEAIVRRNVKVDE